jgi:hypothetical protein
VLLSSRAFGGRRVTVMRLNSLLFVSVAVVGCSPRTNTPVVPGTGGTNMSGQLTTPESARVTVDDTLSKFDATASDVLFRYLAGNERWEIREEGGKKYAVRRERVDGSLKTTLNGFYSTSRGGSQFQTRVLLVFGGEYGFGRERGNVTRTKPGAIAVPVVIESEHSGSPGNSSYLIVNGPAIGLEIFDEAPSVERAFTKAALGEVGRELAAVLTHRDAIKTTGLMPDPQYYPQPLPKVPSFDVTGDWGIYQLTAFVNPTAAGHVETRVFKTSSGELLATRQEQSRRYAGWSDDGANYFPYNAEVMITDGSFWSSSYEARFELWHTSPDGTQTKLAEKTRTIKDWER